MPGLKTEASQEDLNNVEQRVRSKLRSEAQQQLSGVNGADMVHVRDILPNEDLDQDDANNVNGWNGTDREWIQSGLSADTNNQVYEVDATGDMENKILAIFAISTVSADPITTEITFEDGTGSTFERLMFQESQTMTEGDIALLENPIIFDEGKDGVIYQWANSAGQDNVIYHGAVAEKAGTTLGVRAKGEAAASGVARNPGRR